MAGILAESGRIRAGKTKMAGRAGHPGIGGAEEDRTPDLCIANAALSQLSYRPINGIPVADQDGAAF
jgi:hypothetical protein